MLKRDGFYDRVAEIKVRWSLPKESSNVPQVKSVCIPGVYFYALLPSVLVSRLWRVG